LLPPSLTKKFKLAEKEIKAKDETIASLREQLLEAQEELKRIKKAAEKEKNEKASGEGGIEENKKCCGEGEE
jgi:hypothetical protein